MKKVKEKLEITILAFGDTEGDNEDENEEEDVQTVLFNDIGTSDGEKNDDEKVSENNLSLELQKFGYDADDLDLLLEMLPEASLEEENENLQRSEDEGHELCDPKNKTLSQATKDMKGRKVKFNDDLSRTMRQPRLCEMHKNSSDKLSLSNKPLIVANEHPVSAKDSVNGEENENRNSNANTNVEIGFPPQGKRIPAKMRSVNMFNSVLPSSTSSLLKSSVGLKDKSISWTKTNGGRNRVIPVWIKNKSIRKNDADAIQLENSKSIKSITRNEQNNRTIAKYK